LINTVGHESKVGYTSLTASVALQLAKDVLLLQDQPRLISAIVWHFFESPVTGELGPSQTLLRALQSLQAAGYAFEIVMH
jgi:filamentous hemagglutinin